MKVDRDWLKAQSAVPDMDDKVLDELLQLASEKKYNHDEVVFSEFVDFDQVLLVIEGSLVHRSSLLDVAAETEFVVAKPGQFSNAARVVSDLPTTVTCIAVGEVTVLSWNAEDVKKICEEHPEVGYRIISYLSRDLIERLDGINKALLGNVSWGLE